MQRVVEEVLVETDVLEDDTAVQLDLLLREDERRPFLIGALQ